MSAAENENQEVLDDQPRSILLGIISQLRKGADLHRVTLPTFVLEPRSYLERITDFMSHPDIMLEALKTKDAEKRFLLVLKYFLSGWHIQPKGVKKPYNPVLGECFRSKFDIKGEATGYFVAEQTSHHPPISSFVYFNPKGVLIRGESKPKSRFLGNSACTLMEGDTIIKLFNAELNIDDTYRVSLPNVYARGLLFGTMLLELGDFAKMYSSTGLKAEIEFKTKGFFSGSYNAIGGKVVDENDKQLYEISGNWKETMYYKKKTEEVLFDSATSVAIKPLVAPEETQEPYESRRLWAETTKAMKKGDLDTATAEKTKVEDKQREYAKKRGDEEWKPRFFEPIHEDDKDVVPEGFFPEDFKLKILDKYFYLTQDRSW
eukprot:NODE_44_length_33449_cov_1.575742.p8 type:complete len:375 gc:universal NODE_44_length_33449_cov_1.575742:4895-6019(+)